MNNRNPIEELDNIALEISELENELMAMEHCRNNGLDWENAADYSRAVIAVNRAAARRAGTRSNPGRVELHHRNHLDPAGESCYNSAIRKHLEYCRARLENISNYNWFDDLWNKMKNQPRLKRIRQVLIGRAVVNRTPETIMIEGESASSPSITITAFLLPGQSSETYLQDTDWIHILRGQKFYLNRDEAPNGIVVTSGKIKVKDGLREVAVRAERVGGNLYFYVDAPGTHFFIK